MIYFASPLQLHDKHQRDLDRHERMVPTLSEATSNEHAASTHSHRPFCVLPSACICPFSSTVGGQQPCLRWRESVTHGRHKRLTRTAASSGNNSAEPASLLPLRITPRLSRLSLRAALPRIGNSRHRNHYSGAAFLRGLRINEHIGTLSGNTDSHICIV